jgi:hypothetical protein
VPRLSIPQLGEETCEFIRATSLTVLTHEDLAQLRKAVGADLESVRSSAVRIGGSLGTTDAIALHEIVTAHSVAPEEALQEWERYGATDPSYPAADKIAAHVHIELRAEVSASVPEEATNLSVLESVLDWLRANRELNFDVTGFRSFSSAEFETVVSIPAPPRPFTTVRAVTLSKDTDTPAPRTTVYEVHVQTAGDCLHSVVNFRTKLLQGADAFQKIVDSASEIAGFAVRKRAASVDQ